ncbi:unnamed protein product [Phytomonas sp. Hart1]|nr:unnamed protein product [Phytomonas sp. Hart1]|eukprot:CCW65921.1 unnamed protein product [Phytomonas sp. isolate Hart1]
MPHLSTTPRRWSMAKCDVAPPGRIGHTFCADTDGSKAYVYGGVNDTEDSSSNYLDDFWEYNVLEKKWSQRTLTGVLQSPRAFHTAVWYSNRVFIFGGCNGRGRFNQLFTIDAKGICLPVNIPMVASVPSTRYCHSAVLFEGCMYIFGGKCGGRNSNKRLSDLFMCSLDLPMWIKCQQLGEVPPSRSAHTSLTHERTMMVFGGRNAVGECCDDFYMYHFDTSVWRKIISSGPMLFGRARNSAVVHHGSVYVFGGWNGKKKLNDLFLYNIEANIFEQVYDQDCPSRRECHMAVACRNTMVVFGGRFRGHFMNDTVELYFGPKTATDGIRDWLIKANMPREMANMLPSRMRDSFLFHHQFQLKITVD